MKLLEERVKAEESGEGMMGELKREMENIVKRLIVYAVLG